MIYDLTYSDKVVIASIIGGLSGSLLALIVKILYLVLIEKQEIYPKLIKDGFWASVAMALFAGSFTFCMDFNTQLVKNREIQSTFIFIFAVIFVNGAAEILIKIVKLACLAIFSRNNSY